MFRKLSLVLAVSAALSPMGAYALGLGDIVSKSALNERFRADIELLSVDSGELETIRATLASPIDFARSGLERPFLLSKLRFKPMQAQDGRTVIQVTTKDPVREPFLNFLVEVNWPKGRLIREFTVLLDPPVTLERKAPPIVAASSARPPAIKRTPIAARSPAERSGSAPDFIEVEPGTTLWRIATDLNVPGASTEQVMISLYQDNPQAFARRDINRLMAGARLQVPEQERILTISRRAARDEFVALAQGKRPAKGAAKPKSAPASAQAPDERLRLVTARKDEDRPAPEAEPSARAIGSNEIEKVKTDLILVQETSESTRQETDNLRARILELESQLTDIRNLLQLKSDQLAQLQAAKIAPLDVPEAALETAPGLPESPPESPVVDAPPTLVDTSPAQQAVTDAASPPIDEPVIAPPVQAKVPAAPPKALKPPVEKPTPPPAPEKSWLDELASNSTLLAIGGAVVVVLLLLVWLLVRRRKEAEDQFQESVLLTPGDGMSLDLDQDHDTPEKAETGEETSFISDFSPSDIDALQEETGEVDPAAEADVYIAYGRYQQAESLINQAIEKTPDRLDLKLKLMEIYFTTRNPASFVALAEAMDSAKAQQQDPQLWERVQSMGRELVPGHALFGGGDGGGAAKVASAAAATAATVAAATTATGVAEMEMGSDSEMLANLDLDLDTELSELPDEPLGGESGLGDLREGDVLEPPTQSKRPVSEALTDDSVLTTPSPDQEISLESEFSLDLDDLGSLEDIDIGDLDMGSEQPQFEEQDVRPLHVEQPPQEKDSRFVEEEEVPAISLEDLEGISDELDETDELTGLSMSELSTENFSEEVETKLDLARAYMEMNDAEGAREILVEVLAEGDDAQKASAEELMSQLD